MRLLTYWRNFLPAIVAISLSSILVCSRTHRTINESDIRIATKGTDCIFQPNSTATLESDSVHADDLFRSLSDSVVAYYHASLEILSTDVENAFVALWIPILYVFATRLCSEFRKRWMCRYGIEAVVELSEQVDEVKERRTVLKEKRRAFRRFGCFMRRRQTYRPKFRKSFQKHRRRLQARRQKWCKTAPRINSIDQPSSGKTLVIENVEESCGDGRIKLRESTSSTNDSPNRPTILVCCDAFRLTRICYSAPSNLCEGKSFDGCTKGVSTDLLPATSRTCSDIEAVDLFKRKVFCCLRIIPIPRKMIQTLQLYVAGGIEFLPTAPSQLFIETQLSAATHLVNMVQKESSRRPIVLENPASALSIIKKSNSEMKPDQLTLIYDNDGDNIPLVRKPKQLMLDGVNAVLAIETDYSSNVKSGSLVAKLEFSGPSMFSRQGISIARASSSLAETPRTNRRSRSGSYEGTESTVKMASFAFTENDVALKVVDASMFGSCVCEADVDTESNGDGEKKGSTTELARPFDRAIAGNSVISVFLPTCSTDSNSVETKCSILDQAEEETDQSLSNDIDQPIGNAGINIQEWVDSTKKSYLMAASECAPTRVAIRALQTARLSYSATDIRKRNRIYEKSTSERDIVAKSVSFTCLNDVEVIPYFICKSRSSRALRVSQESIRMFELQDNVGREFSPRCCSQFSIETRSSDVMYSAGMEDCPYRPIVSEEPETMVSIMKESKSEMEFDRMSLISESAGANFPRVRRPGHQMLERMDAVTDSASLEMSNTLPECLDTRSVMKESESEIDIDRLSLISGSAGENFPRIRRPGHEMLGRVNTVLQSVSLEMSKAPKSSWKSKIKKITAGLKIKKSRHQKIEAKELLIAGGRFSREVSFPLNSRPYTENGVRSGLEDKVSPKEENLSLTGDEEKPELRSSEPGDYKESNQDDEPKVSMAVHPSTGLNEKSSTDSVTTVDITFGRRNIAGQTIHVRPADVPKLDLDLLSERESSAASSCTLCETLSYESRKQQSPSVMSTDRRETLAQIPSYVRLENNLVEDDPLPRNPQPERSCLAPSAASEEVPSYLGELRQEISQLSYRKKVDFCQRTASANIAELENLETELEHIFLSIDKIHNRSKKGFKRIFALCRPRRGKIRRLEKQKGLLENDIQQCNQRIEDILLVWQEEEDENNRKRLQEKLRFGISLQKEAILKCVREAMKLRTTINTGPDDVTLSICYDCSVGSHVAELAVPFSNPLLSSEEGFPQTCPVVRAVNTRYNALKLDRVGDLTDSDLEKMKMLQKQIQWGLFRKAYLQHGYFK